MTAITVAPTAAPRGSNALRVIRLQLVNKQTFIWIPLLILGGSLLISLAIYGIVRNAGATAEIFGGGAQAPLWYFAVIGAQALTKTFPFSQALSVTRRDFFFGTLMTAVLTALMLSGIFMLGGLFEQATNGWWFNAWFFYIPGIWAFGAWAAGLFYFATAMFAFMIGFLSATIYRRFGTLWVVIGSLATGLVLVIVLWFIGYTDSWVQVWEWIVTQTTAGISLWMLLVAAVMAVGSFLAIRRATA